MDRPLDRPATRPPPPVRRRKALLLLAGVSLAHAAAAHAAEGQQPRWTTRTSFQALAVEDDDDWLEFRQEGLRRWSRGDAAWLRVVETRRFDAWDQSLEGGGTLHPTERLYLTLEGRATPDADVLDDFRIRTQVAYTFGPFVPSLGYQVVQFDDDEVHVVSYRLEWYHGPWFVSGEGRVIRSAVETVNVAGIGRASRRLGPDWEVWLGVAAGEEDFLVGPPENQLLRTLTTESVFGGAEWSGLPGWAVRVDLSAVDSDPRLSRAGGSLSIARYFF